MKAMKIKMRSVLALCPVAASLLFTACLLVDSNGFGSAGTAGSEDHEMVLVRGGSFRMGSESGGNNNERPVHTVTLSDFLIGEYEVTQTLYESVMRNNPSRFNKIPDSPHGQRIPGAFKQPVENVTWYDAVEFCNKLSVKEGLEPVYTISLRRPSTGHPITSATVTPDWSKNGYCLPTEAQWEYAARGGNGSPGNYIYAGSDNVKEVAWYIGYGYRAPQMVGKKEPNYLGIYDMSGNVSEWCWDRSEDYSSEAQTNPAGPTSAWNNMRVVRGGGWSDSASDLRTTRRKFEFPDKQNDSIGFRLVRN